MAEGGTKECQEDHLADQVAIATTTLLYAARCCVVWCNNNDTVVLQPYCVYIIMTVVFDDYKAKKKLKIVQKVTIHVQHTYV